MVAELKSTELLDAEAKFLNALRELHAVADDKKLSDPDETMLKNIAIAMAKRDANSNREE
jgi:hypothetical protein